MLLSLSGRWNKSLGNILFQKSLQVAELLYKSTYNDTYYLPIRAAEHAFQIIQKTFENQQSLETNEYKLSQQNPPNDPKFFEAMIANYSLYVVTICNTDGILHQFSKQILARLEEIPISIKQYQHDSFLDHRKNEISDYIWYRNKLFAHTSYAAPGHEIQSIRDTLLMYYAGEFIGFRPPYATLGGVSVISEEDRQAFEDMHSLRGEQYLETWYQFHPPEICIMAQHQNFIRHYSVWDVYICKLLNALVINCAKANTFP